jgi:threonine dehydratase
MLSTITPSPRGGGEIHKLPPTTLVEESLAHVVKCALESTISLKDALLARRVFETITRFLHRAGIGQTRVADLVVDGKSLFTKLENENPTGSYKLRGAYLGVAVAVAAGAQELVTASTGNHGGDANYAAAAFGIPLKIFVPEETPVNKLALLRGPRTEIRPIKGEFAHAKHAAQGYAEHSGAFYLAPYDAAEAICGQALSELSLQRQDCHLTPQWFPSVVVD